MYWSAACECACASRPTEPSLTQRLPCCRLFFGRHSASLPGLPRRTMDEDLVEPGGSNVGTQKLQAEVYLETSERPPTPTKSTENEALLPPDTRPAWTSPVERAAIEMSKRRQMTRMKPSVPYVALSGAQLIVGAAIVGVGGAAFATTSNYRPGCFWAGLVVRLNLSLSRSYNSCVIFSDSSAEHIQPDVALPQACIS